MARMTLACLFLLTLVVGSAAAAEPDGAGLRKALQELLDSDQDGTINDKEAEQGIKAIADELAAGGATADELRALLDRSGDGRVDRRELEAGVAGLRAGTKPGKSVDDLFQRLDSNRNDAISDREFRQVADLVAAVNPEAAAKLEQVFAFLDRNQDLQVTRDEALMVADFLSQAAWLGGGRGKGPAAAGEAADEVIEDKIMQHAAKTLADLDQDENGTLSRTEAAKNRRLAKVFRKVDQDRNGQLTVTEMHVYLRSLAAPSADGGR